MMETAKSMNFAGSVQKLRLESLVGHLHRAELLETGRQE